MAHESQVLVLYDSATEALYVIAVPSKECTPWIVAWVKAVIDELVLWGIEIRMKMDGARELLQLRREVAVCQLLACEKNNTRYNIRWNRGTGHRRV